MREKVLFLKKKTVKTNSTKNTNRIGICKAAGKHAHIIIVQGVGQ